MEQEAVIIPTEPHPCRCMNCNRDYDLSLQYAICPHQLRAEEGGIDSLEPRRQAKPTMTTDTTKLIAELLGLLDIINEPPDYEDRYRVREYRHYLYSKAEPVIGNAIQALRNQQALDTLESLLSQPRTWVKDIIVNEDAAYIAIYKGGKIYFAHDKTLADAITSIAEVIEKAERNGGGK